MMPRRFQEQAATGLRAAASRGRVALVLWAVAASAQAATVADPEFSPWPGTYKTAQTVTISTTTAGARIFYTTDSTTPTTGSTLYEKPLEISAPTKLKAIAEAPGYETSAVVVGTYEFVAGIPDFSPPEGVYDARQDVKLSTVTPGAQIYYTTDGTTPTTASPVYSAPISVGASATLQAIAVAPGFSDSPVAIAAYTIGSAGPTFAPAPGRYAAVQSVAISSATRGAQIYYTLDGTVPTTTSMLYSGPVTIAATTTLNAIAVVAGSVPSPVATATYVIEPPAPAPAPRFDPLPGRYPGPVNVTLSADVSFAKIYFTLDDTAPTVASSTYTTPIAIAGDATIRAVVVAPDYLESPETRGTYSAAPASRDGIAAEFIRSRTTTAQAVRDQFSTVASDLLLLAFVSSGGRASESPALTSSDLTWTPLVSANTQPGFAGIWWATAPVPLTGVVTQVTRASSGTPLTLTIVALVGARRSPGAVEVASGTSGLPTVTFAATAAGAWYYAVGSDTSAATPRRLPAGQTLVSETTAAASGADLWVQQNATAPPPGGASLALGASSPTSASWNLAAVEVLPEVLPPPGISPAAGAYDRPITVTLRAPKPGARIRYTTDGTSPTAASAEYTGPITVSGTTTVNAIAEDGYSTSAVATATYTVVRVLVSLAVQAPSTTLATGGSMQCTATGTYGDGSTRDITSQVTWASSDPAVASVSASGLVTGAAAGAATITATSGAIAGSVAVSVKLGGITYCYDGAGNMTARIACPTGQTCEGQCP